MGLGEDEDEVMDVGLGGDEDEVMDVGFGVVLPIARPGTLDGGGECDKKLPPPAVVVPVKPLLLVQHLRWRGQPLLLPKG